MKDKTLIQFDNFENSNVYVSTTKATPCVAFSCGAVIVVIYNFLALLTINTIINQFIKAFHK